MGKTQTKQNEASQNGTELNESEEKQLTPEEIKAQQKEQAKKERLEREQTYKESQLYFERTVPGEMACRWLTEGAKKELGMTLDKVVSFRLSEGDLVIGAVPQETAVPGGEK